ncbi:MAG: hypothetical protein GF393_00010, partial [Armatimonadia bacterium]|nr:hypothetical protein [Armatimonadia bacterium]
PYIGEWGFDGLSYREHRPPIYALAYAYAVTREQKYADRVLLILNRLAENYRWYNGRADTGSDIRGYPGRAYIEDENFECGHVQTLAAAYDMVFDAIDDADHVLAFFEDRHGADYDGDGAAGPADLRYNIEHNMFGYMWEFLTRSNRIARGNMRMRQLLTMIHLALHFRNDTIIEHAIDGPKGFRHALTGSFYRDGRNHEDSSNYAYGVNCTFQLMRDLLEQYEGREVYQDGFDAQAEFGQIYPMIDTWSERAWCAGRRWFYGDGGVPRYPILEEPDGPLTDTVLCHEAGLTMMRQGSDYRTRKHALLYHSLSGQGHGHRDQLMLKTIAYGYDFTADIGYPANLRSAKRHAWTSNTITHPTVIIDETPQPRGTSASAELFGRCEWAQVASAYSRDTYPEAPLYHRTAALVEVDRDHHFIVDVFRVVGGEQHDWLWHSLSGEDGRNFEISCADALQSRAGTLAGPDVEYTADTENGYSWLKDISEGTVAEGIAATWRVGDEQGTGYRVHMLGAPGRTVFVGRGEGRGTLGRSPLDAYLVVRSGGQAPRRPPSSPSTSPSRAMGRRCPWSLSCSRTWTRRECPPAFASRPPTGSGSSSHAPCRMAGAKEIDTPACSRSRLRGPRGG